MSVGDVGVDIFVEVCAGSLAGLPVSSRVDDMAILYLIVMPMPIISSGSRELVCWRYGSM